MSPFFSGVRDCFGVPALGLTAAVLGYGVQAQASGIGLELTIVSVFAIWAMPVMMTYADTVARDGGPWLMLMAVMIVNLRTLPMVVAALPLIRVGRGFQWSQLVMAQLVSPTSWVQISVIGDQLAPTDRRPYFVGFSLTLLTGGVIGGWLGYTQAAAMPLYVLAALLFLTPAFVLLTMATARRFSGHMALVIGGIFVPVLMEWSADWGMLIGGVGAGTAGFLIGRRTSSAGQRG